MDVLIFCHVYCIFPCILKSGCSYSILVKMVQFFGRGLRYYRPFSQKKAIAQKVSEHIVSGSNIDEPPPEREAVPSQIVNWDGMQWDIWRWRWRCYQTSSNGGFSYVIIYMLPKVACFISFTVVLVTFVGFFLPWRIVNRNNGLEEVVALLSNCIGWRRLSRYYNNDRGDYRTIASRSLQ